MEKFTLILETYAPLIPEIIIALSALFLLLLGAFKEKSAELIGWLAIVVMVVVCFVIISQFGVQATLFHGAVIVDSFASFMKILVLVGTIFIILLSFHYMKSAALLSPEYIVMILFSVLGMMLMISANDLISLFLGLELQSFGLYVIAALRRDALRSSEAGLKYFVLGALSSGMLLYGASFIYGFTGATTFPEIATALQNAQGVKLELIFGLVFLLAGFAFKISAVPFHMWTPDVYEGSPTPVTAFFAAAPKIAAMALLMRTTLQAFPSVTIEWQQIIIFLSIASMLLGAFAAIGQSNIKRLMAYSSIGHMGYALVGLAAGNSEGTSAIVFYLVIYLAMTLGTFACILSMRRSEGMVEDIDELSGLAQNNLPMAFLLAMLLFSLAGIPPLAGFFAKFFIFSAAVKAGLYPLAIIGVLASVVAAYYYLRIIIIMFVKEPVEPFEPVPDTHKFVIFVSSVIVIFYVFYPAPLRVVSEIASKSLL